SMGRSRLSGLLPAEVMVVEACARWDPGSLFPVERAYIADAPLPRQAEFSTVRRCAAEALARLGRARLPMVPGRDGAPSWPDGVVGSMTHCQGVCAAAVTDDPSIAGVGIDIERVPAGPSDLLDLVVMREERAALKWLRGPTPAGLWEQVVFSAKESVYKAWHPVEHRWLGFEDVVIDVRQDSLLTGSFGVVLLNDSCSRARWRESAQGRWTADEDFVATALVLRGDLLRGDPGTKGGDDRPGTRDKPSRDD
ncbi:MAG TPA: 4'-phosphopantetheinyl transferase superfamily protein, partial [Propionibacteriaceae bacterium]|nr:4'-phosphopantetheinyl transferase superfamily protein [Propionibacteriaceae bacterium]